MTGFINNTPPPISDTTSAACPEDAAVTSPLPSPLGFSNPPVRVETVVVTGPPGSPGPVGPTGRGLASGAVNPAGHLIMTFTDGSTQDAGSTVGPVGLPGVSVASLAVSPAGHLIATFSDASTHDAGYVMGPPGGLTATGSTTAGNAVIWGSTPNTVVDAGGPPLFADGLGNVTLQGSLYVSKANTTGGGIVLSADGDIVDLNDGFASMRFGGGVRVYSANRGGSPVVTLGSTGVVTLQNPASGQAKLFLNGGGSGARSWSMASYGADQTGSAGSFALVDESAAAQRILIGPDGIVRAVNGLAGQTVDAYGFGVRSIASASKGNATVQFVNSAQSVELGSITFDTNKQLHFLVNGVEMIGLNANRGLYLNSSDANIALRAQGNGGVYIQNDAGTTMAMFSASGGARFYAGINSSDTVTTFLRQDQANEGGELHLQQPVNSNGTGGDYIVDANSSLIRFFEGGGGFRGAFIDLSLSRGGVGTNLARGGDYQAPGSTYLRATADKLNEAISLADYIANPGNVRSDTDALAAAVTAVENLGPGGRIYVPPRSTPYLWDGEVISQIISSARGLQIYGVPFATKINVAPLNNNRQYWIDVQDGGVSMSGLAFYDPNGYITSGKSALRAYGSQTGSGNSGVEWESRFEDLYFEGRYSAQHNVSGMDTAITIDGGNYLKFNRIHTVNVNYGMTVVSGGIDCTLSDSRFYNACVGVWLNSPYAGQGISHTEGFHVEKVKVLCPDPANGVVPSAFRISEGLWIMLTRCEGIQLAPGGIGLDMQVGTNHGVVMVDDVGCYWEGGTNGWCIKATGNWNNFFKRGGALSNAAKSNVSPMSMSGNGANRLGWDCFAAPLNGTTWAQGYVQNVGYQPSAQNIQPYRTENPPIININP